MLTAEEIDRIEADLPDLALLSTYMLVPFLGRKLQRAKVVWLNERWLLARGICVYEASTRARVERWLLDNFGFVSGTGNVPDEFADDAPSVLYADRYGSTAGTSPHGGSGRVATIGRFQVKGVGITPLVGKAAQGGHAHGCLSLSEALREAILAELIDCEFPFGAIPTIAVIDTGIRFSSPDRSERFDHNVRRALSIRPAAVRLAHAERAPCFIESVNGFTNSQKEDSKRTRHVVQQWIKPDIQGLAQTLVPLPQVLERIARQAAFGFANRIFRVPDRGSVNPSPLGDG